MNSNFRLLLGLAVLASLPLPNLATSLADPASQTEITSETLEMQGTEFRNYFYFRKNVRVVGNNLEITCDDLTVCAIRAGSPDAAVGQVGAIESIVATGNVHIRQEGREAFAARAEVDPKAGTVTLTGNPRIKDREVEVEGYKFILHKDRKTFESIPDPNATPGSSRSVVRLGALPDLGFNQEASHTPTPPESQPPAQGESPATPNGGTTTTEPAHE